MKIRRRTFSVDFLGRLLSQHVEELTEDGQGNVEEIHASAVYACEACGRPVEKVDDVRGRCVECGRLCCVACEGACAVCRRPLCGECRLGFDDKGLSVCGACLARLEQRLARQDRLLDDKVAFERAMTVYGNLVRLLPPGGVERGSISEVLAHIAQVRLARRLSRIADRIEQEENDGRRLLS